MDLTPFGKILILIGLLIAAAGILLALGLKIPWIGRLPGDLFIKGKYGTLYLPLMSCLIISILISLALFFFRNR
ncbi:MAG: DUF2905 domain-containing protein [Syntrophales bacterium]|nr:DUF2905 domain-containing protein [Syntrophales bacterium]